MVKNKILKDTFFLTAVEFILQGISLLLNVFFTRKLGSDIMGITALIGSFFNFVTIISSGNVYLSASRFISEEIGKRNGSPDTVFRYGIISSVSLSIFSGILIFTFSGAISGDVLKSPQIEPVIKILAMILPISSVNACIKGYFTAVRNVSAAAAGGVIEFLVKSGLLAFFAEFMMQNGKIDVLTAFAVSVACGQLFSCIFMAVMYARRKKTSGGRCSMKFRSFVFSSVPIFLNSIVTSVLSSTNDALVPVTLKQYGDSTSQAFSQFGIFEAIVIPALFFPSSILCSLSSILVPELARERCAENDEKNACLIKKVLKQTFSFSIFTAMIFLCFGKEIGYIMSGDYFAGKVIAVLAPAVPFIYLEIILEGVLKGMGKHSFSSLNYLVEYTIRISVVLIFVPVFGFYGIVASYLASNIICNISRLVMIMKITKLRFSFSENILIPVLSATAAAQLSFIIERLIFESSNINIIFRSVVCALISLVFYIIFQKLLSRIGKYEKEPLIPANQKKYPG
ncbi:MAG: oligosaccharide flippase family protein [Porcipelethomonas sp.]